MALAIQRQRLTVRKQRRPMLSYAADFLAFSIAASITFNLHVIGDLPIAEIILLSALPFLVALRPNRAFSPLLKMIYCLLALWLFGQVISDIYNETREVDWIRGDAAIIFFGIDIAGLTILLAKNEIRKVLFIVGFAVGSLVSTAFFRPDLTSDIKWKFGYALGTILIVLIISSFFYGRRMFVTSGLLLIGIMAVNLILNFRHPVLVLLVILALMFPIVPERIGGVQILPRAGNAMRIVVLALFAVGAAWAAQTLVNYVTAAGLISEEAREKNELQAKSGNLLLGGRPEILVSSRAVMANPIVGYGSWARDRKYSEMLFDLQVEMGAGLTPEELDEDLEGYIPAHSHLMGAWVWAGILGALFWFYILWLTAQAIVRASVLRQRTAPIYLWILVEFFWDTLFSPFGNWQRIWGTMAVILMVDLLDHREPAIATLRYWTRRHSLGVALGTSRSAGSMRLRGAWRGTARVRRN